LRAYRREVLASEVHVHGSPAGSGRLRIALVFPSEYAVGMANLALQGLYRLLSERPEVLCERVFYPGIPERGRQRDGTLRSLEHATALGAFDVIAITSSYELDWLNVAAALRDGGVPPLAAERPAQAPLVIAGGPAITSNPEPLAPLMDALYIGEAEPRLDELVEALLAADLHSEHSRAQLLARLAQLRGLYVPTVDQPRPIERVVLADLDEIPTTTTILSPRSEFPDTFLIQVGRGCPRGCRFCLARRIYHPVRMRSSESILSSAELGLRFTRRIGLVGAGIADHPRLDEIATKIVAMGGKVSTSSLRAERVTPALVGALASSGQRTITLAPETADEKLAATLGKRVGYDCIRDAARLAREAGMTDVKLYFMLGIPGETDDAASRIVDFVEALEADVPGMRTTVAAGALVPKPHTELARVAVPEPAVVSRRLKRLRRELKHRTGAQVRLASARWGGVQTALSRGGRELAPVILDAGRDAGPGEFERALHRRGLSLEEYLGEQTGAVPWDVAGEYRSEGVPR